VLFKVGTLSYNWSTIGERGRRRREKEEEEKGEKGEGEGGRRSPYRGAAGGFFASCSVFITTPCGLHWQLQYRTK
jgi:hypothetical protein